jgi:hypothetical protein
MAGKSTNSFGAKNWSPGPPSTRYNASGKNREFYTFENAPGLGAYATGGTIIDGGDGYIYHIFTGNGTFTVNRPPAAIDSVDYLIVAGGGGASAGPGANAGGGGGGMLFGNIGVSNAPGVYSITVGGGGPSAPGQPGVPRNGSPSTAFGLTATGGGGGAASGGFAAPGSSGGSGGGGFAGAGGSGNTPPTIPRQGYNGGLGPPAVSTNAGGGGGAGGLGSAATAPAAPVGAAGGPGRIAPEFPSTIISRAIPAPVLPAWNPLVGPGGYAAGGHGMNVPAPLQRTSPANSGYGGQTGGLSGGSGIVCVRYKKTVGYSRATGGTIEPNTHPEHPGVWRHIFTSPGDFTVTDPTLQYIDYLAVGGGGGGGGSPTVHGGGGGAGGFVSSIQTSTSTPTSIPEAYPWNPGYSVQVGEQYPVGVGTYPIGIGTGGDAGTPGNDTTIGNPGGTQIIAAGGGRGATSPGNGANGASGGGGAKPAPSTASFSGGTATPTPLIQGNNGGTTPSTPAQTVGAGGGGAGGSGGGIGGGGVGWYSVLSPSAYGTPGPLTPTTIYRYFAGGGGGRPSTTGGAGGGGGGSTSTSGTPGTTNTGGGGGGGTSALGGTGGPGIVIIQYPE